MLISIVFVQGRRGLTSLLGSQDHYHRHAPKELLKRFCEIKFSMIILERILSEFFINAIKYTFFQMFLFGTIATYVHEGDSFLSVIADKSMKLKVRGQNMQ